MGLILRAQIGKNGMSKVFVLASEILLKFGVADQCLHAQSVGSLIFEPPGAGKRTRIGTNEAT